ncbi:MAG TPA: carotenoid oxygenase family protein [Thermoleophilaceae bacterium]
MATHTAAPATTRRVGFETLDEEVSRDRLPLRGELPDWLAGTLVRVTPALLDVGGQPLRHWFDGLAMLNAFGVADGQVSYGSRFLDTDTNRRARAGELFTGFAQDPCRSLFRRAMAVVSGPSSDNANVNLMQLGDRYMAMTEIPMPVEFDPETLATLGIEKYDDRVGGQVTTAHPHHDPARDEALNYVTQLGARNSYRLYAQPAGSDSRRLIAKIGVREPGYMHSFGMSERYLILAEFPLVVNPLHLATGGRPFIDNFRWEPERGTRFIVVDRHSGELRGIYDGPAFFAFHHVNAYERDGELVVDLCAYDDATVIGLLELENLREGDRLAPLRLQRCRIDLDGGGVEYEQLSEHGMELPRINYGAVNGRDYRYAYGAGTHSEESDWSDQLVKADVATGESRTWHEPGCYPGEPVFVSGPERRAEDDGVILSVVLDAAAGRSFLLVLDAASFEEVARAEAPQRIPFGFHGQFFGS